jgi:hypothetical protein
MDTGTCPQPTEQRSNEQVNHIRVAYVVGLHRVGRSALAVLDAGLVEQAFHDQLYQTFVLSDLARFYWIRVRQEHSYERQDLIAAL